MTTISFYRRLREAGCVRSSSDPAGGGAWVDAAAFSIGMRFAAQLRSNNGKENRLSGTGAVVPTDGGDVVRNGTCRMRLLRPRGGWRWGFACDGLVWVACRMSSIKRRNQTLRARKPRMNRTAGNAVLALPRHRNVRYMSGSFS